jgi:hypothetical protein
MKPFHAAAIAAVLAFAPLASALQIGAWVGSASDTSKDGSYPQPTDENVKAFVQLQGRSLDYVEYYCIWPNTWATVKPYADIAAENGATLFVTWQPNGYTAPDINNGKADAYIKKFATAVKSYPHEVWLRPLHEANGGDWYTWAVGNSSMKNTDSNVAEAFRHIVKIFRDSGVTNVKWVWTTNGENSSGGNPTTFAGTYPGDDWCDYISIDCYNFGTFHTVENSGWNSSWRSFAQAFKPSYAALAGINKPIFVAEFSSSELGGDKAKWYRDAFASLSKNFPRFFALMIFSMNDANGDWRINTTDSSLQAWRECVAQYAPSAGISRTGAGAMHSLARAIGPGRIQLALPAVGEVQVRIHDLRGNLLERRSLGNLSAGEHVLDLGPSNVVRLVSVSAGGRSESLRVGLVP